MEPFHVADLNAQGETRSVQAYDYATLERLPGCAAIILACSNELYRHPDGFELTLPPRVEPVTLRWTATAPTAGLLIVRAAGALASVSVLATGLSADADAITLGTFQRHLTQELHDTGYEPAFGLVALRERPLVATVAFEGPLGDDARLTVALLDRCFAASYFRYHQLA